MEKIASVWLVESSYRDGFDAETWVDSAWISRELAEAHASYLQNNPEKDVSYSVYEVKVRDAG